MKNQELIRHLKAKGYRRVTLETDSREPKTYYTYRRGLHINATGKPCLSTSCPRRKAWDWEDSPYVRPRTVRVSRQERIAPDCFSRACCRS